MEDDLNFLTMEDDLILLKMEDDLNFFGKGDDLNFFENGKWPNFYILNESCICFLKRKITSKNLNQKNRPQIVLFWGIFMRQGSQGR